MPASVTAVRVSARRQVCWDTRPVLVAVPSSSPTAPGASTTVTSKVTSPSVTLPVQAPVKVPGSRPDPGVLVADPGVGEPVATVDSWCGR